MLNILVVSLQKSMLFLFSRDLNSLSAVNYLNDSLFSCEIFKRFFYFRVIFTRCISYIM